MTTQVEPIRGKVARILNSREVALNIGRDDGVTPGMFFDILVPDLDNITDPDTNESLGSLDIAKTRVKVIRTQGRLAVAATYRKKRVNVGGRGFLAGGMFEAPRWVTKYETLKTTDSTWENLTDEDSYISRGDPVVQVFSNNELE